jgi:hypothetical protein
MNSTPMQTQPVSPTHPFTVNLEAQQWNAVLAAISEAPYRVAAPLVQAISEQLQAQAQAGQAHPNGPSVVPDLAHH